MEKRVINQKLESLRKCVRRIKEKTPLDAIVLETDFDIQDIISVNFERAVQQCIDVASHILSEFDDVSGQSAASLFQDLGFKGYVSSDVSSRLVYAAGFRNLLVHRYAEIDWKRVFNSLRNDVRVFSSFTAEISKKLEL